MGTPGIPLISAMPQFSSAATPPDDLTAASPNLQALLSQMGGPQGTHNLDAMGASSPQFGQMLSLMSPGGGLNPQQASQFGPLFALLMGMQGGGK